MNRQTFINALKGGAIGIAVATGLLFAFNFIALSTDDPDMLLSVLAHAARFTGAAAAGFSASRMNRENGLINGALGGVVYSLPILLISAFSEGSFSFFFSILLTLLSVAISAVFGLLGLPGEKSGRARRKNMIKRFK